MRIGVPKETCPGETRVACVPAVVEQLKKIGIEAVIQSGAGVAAGFTDELYTKAGATLSPDRAAIFRDCEAILQVRSLGANPKAGAADTALLRTDQILIGHGDPLLAHDATKALAARGVTFFAMELVPRITRAQSMDALSSQANLAGYKAVIMAAMALGKIFPMMMTAAGTVTPAKVFVLGAGVAGLQAIATAKRLGAVVSATDVRAAVKDQVESLGGKFVFLAEITSEGEGGYAKELTPEQQAKQKELVASVVADSDVVITTAAIPGRKSPVLVTAQMVQRMRPGGVIVDLAAERGGNCELTEADQTVVKHGVTLIGHTNIPALVPTDASLTYSRNLLALLKLIVKDGKLNLDMNDEVIAGTVVTKGGQVVHPKVRQAMGV